jgi:5-methylthioribose kinase
MIDVESKTELEEYLKKNHRISLECSIQTALLTGGVSNKTVLVNISNGECFVVKQALKKLRVQVDWFSDPARIIREADGIQVLSQYAAPGTIPKFLFLDRDEYLLGMEAVPEPHENYKTQLLRGIVNQDLIQQFATLLSQIHSRSSKDVGQLKERFQDREYFKTLRLEPYYGFAAEQVPEVSKFMNALIEETLSFQLSLVHGDYSPKNVLVRNDQIVLLDHEVIHLGDPAFDCGFAMTHYLGKALHLRESRDEFLQAAKKFWETYLKGLDSIDWSGPEFESRVVRQLLGCLLARVEGRSTLEYLSESEKKLQKEVTVSLISDQPETIAEMIESFGKQLQQS